MFRSNPEITIICVAVGSILIARGWTALRKHVITIKKTIGLPWQYDDLKQEQRPRLFLFTAWGIILLGVFFLLFPFVVEYFV